MRGLAKLEVKRHPASKKEKKKKVLRRQRNSRQGEPYFSKSVACSKNPCDRRQGGKSTRTTSRPDSLKTGEGGEERLGRTAADSPESVKFLYRPQKRGVSLTTLLDKKGGVKSSTRTAGEDGGSYGQVRKKEGEKCRKD